MRHRLLLLFILIVAAGLRLYGLHHVSPPGLAHDEVAHWLINRDILAGNHSVYFTEAYGHEAGFHYLQTLFMVLLGDNALALRLPAAFCGLLLVAVSYALAKRMFGRKVALLAAGLLAVLFWPVFFSRQALRAISLPLVSGLSAYFFWWAWDWPPGARGPSRHSRFTFHVSRFTPFILAGFFAGLSLYTYMAARAMPIFYGLFVIYLFLFHRPLLSRQWRGVLLFFLVFMLVALPLALYLVSYPGAEFRISEVDAPLQALKRGDFGPSIGNSLKVSGMFILKGDRLWRQNVAGRPVFDPLTGLLFYGGLLFSLWRIRDSRHAFLLLWLFASVLPSVLTIDAPSTIRMVNALPVLTLLPAIVIHKLGHLSTALPKLSTAWRKKLATVVFIAVVALTFGRTIEAIFYRWPSNAEVQFVWQQALTEAAAYLDAVAYNGDVAIGGWTPESMDPPTIALTLRRDDLELRYFNPTRSLIVPAVSPDENSRIIHPTNLPLDPLLEAELNQWGATAETQGSFTLHTLPFPPPVHPEHPADTLFGNELILLGYDQPTPCHPATLSPCHLVTFWRVERPPAGPRRLFLHLVDDTGETIAQADGLDAPAEFWQPGDILLHHHTLDAPAGGPYSLRLGVYDPITGARVPVGSQTDYVEIQLEEE